MDPADFSADVRLEQDLMKRSRTWVGGGPSRGREEWRGGRSRVTGSQALAGGSTLDGQQGTRHSSAFPSEQARSLGNPVCVVKDTGLGKGGRWIPRERQAVVGLLGTGEGTEYGGEGRSVGKEAPGVGVEEGRMGELEPLHSPPKILGAWSWGRGLRQAMEVAVVACAVLAGPGSARRVLYQAVPHTAPRTFRRPARQRQEQGRSLLSLLRA